MTDGLVVDVDDLVGHPGATRRFSGRRLVSLRLGDTIVDGPMEVSGTASGTVDGVIATFTVSAPAHYTCVRCLGEWEARLGVEGTQHFARVPDEDGYAIIGRTVDVSGPVVDELALGIPSSPLCRPGCRGLCPICGNDLNSDPCDGHGEGPDSPFAALRDLFDP